MMLEWVVEFDLKRSLAFPIPGGVKSAYGHGKHETEKKRH